MHAQLTAGSELGYYALAAILIAGMIAFGNRTYRKEYLSRWSLVFLLIGVTNVLGYGLSRQYAGETIPVPLSLISGALAGAILWGLFRGGFEMAVRRPPGMMLAGPMLLVTIFAGGTGAVLFWLIDGSEWRWLVSLNGAAIGTASLMSAFLLIWERRRRLAPGFLVCAASVTLMGIANYLDAVRLVTGALGPWLFPLVLFSIVLCGCSVMLFAVEDDRQAALLAATQIEHIAYYDPLTGLANRSLFLDRLIAITSMPTGPETAAVLFIDIDHFKLVNDTYGHSVGDAVIRTIAGRLRSALRRSDLAARYAGDEFIVLIDDLKTEADVNRIGEKLLACIEGPILTGGREIRVTGTVGISIYPQHGTTAETLIRNADAAMYQAKQDGRNQYGIFDPERDAPVRPEADLEAALRRAIADEQLSVLYQPIVSLGDGSIRGVESFVRWHDDVLGTVPPSEFIPIAESASLIGPLGELVLHMVCRDAAEWLEQSEGPPVFVSVNLSPEQFADPDLVPRVRRVIARWRIDPGSLQFEVAETTAMADLRRTGRVLESLRELGVKVALDHFGVGQSSLSHLAQFPVEMLKLDRTLLSGDLGTLRYGIFAAAASIAQRLGKIVAVEGIETANQKELAVREHCDLGQGFFFGAPATAEEIAEILRLANGHGSPRVKDNDLDDEITLVSRRASKKVRDESASQPVTLVVDDDERMRNLMAILLRRVGHEVRTAEDGEALLAMMSSLDQSQVRLIVLDLMMPKVSGWDVLDELSKSYPEILSRVLLVTAAGSHEVARIDSSLYGDVIEKPFDQADFYESAARCVGDLGNSRRDEAEGDGELTVH